MQTTDQNILFQGRTQDHHLNSSLTHKAAYICGSEVTQLWPR